jgi:hypothetical protein
MESSGVVVREPLRKSEVRLFRDGIAECLADARNEQNHNQNRLTLAYTAILKCALLALRAIDLRMKPVRGHHIFAMESLAETLGADAQEVDYLRDLAQARHQEIYSAVPVTDSDVAGAIEAAMGLAQRLDTSLQARGLLAP